MLIKQELILSLGSNKNNPLERLKEAVSLIGDYFETTVLCSRIYQTSSWGYESSDYLNCAIMLRSTYFVFEIANVMQEIERKMGRVSKTRDLNYHDRIIDIDLISYGNTIINTQKLSLPHPRIEQRKFVLIPIRDIKPHWRHPISGVNLEQLIENCNDTGKIIPIEDI